MQFVELMKRIKLSPSRKTEYFLKHKSFIDKEKLFLEEMIRIAYNLGKLDVTQEHIENYKRLFPEVENSIPKRAERDEDSERSERLTGLNSGKEKNILTGLKSKRRKTK